MRVFNRIQGLGVSMEWAWRSRHFRWAHKPLCDRFHGEVLRLGPFHFCRSCTLLISGLICGTILGFATAGLARQFLPYWTLGIFIAAIFSWPPWYARFSRSSRDVIRGATGLNIGGLVVTCGSISWILLAVVMLVLLGLRQFILMKRAQGQQMTACETCPENQQDQVCSGFQQQALVSLEFESAVSERLMSRYS